jgi:hypothetical protein
MAMAQQGNMDAAPDFNSELTMKYSQRLCAALTNGIQEIITHKGFMIKGPYNSFDDLTFGDKKDTYLAVVPYLTILVQDKIVEHDSSAFTGINSVKGVIQVTGEFRVDLMEPLTKEKVLAKRINLSDLSIQKEYKREWQIMNPSLPGMAKRLFSMNTQLVDTTDRALADAVNEFYAKAMDKIEIYLSPEEIVSFKDQINNLKGLKRF